MTLSAFNLYRSRIAQYIDEMSLVQQVYEGLLPEEIRLKIIDFIRDFQEKYSKRETKRLIHFFDELACSRQFYDQFSDALLAAIPEAVKDPPAYDDVGEKLSLYTVKCLFSGFLFLFLPALTAATQLYNWSSSPYSLSVSNNLDSVSRYPNSLPGYEPS